MMRTRYAETQAYRTLDGSEIRELMHPNSQPVCHQSLAEALIPAGGGTLLHLHRSSEELYHVTSGRGRMTLGRDRFEIAEGDTVLIPPGTPHRVDNPGPDPLRLLCACSPAYRHEDTEILGQ